MFELLALFLFIIFLVVLCFIIFVVTLISYSKKDKRAADADEKIAQLPPIHFHSQVHDSGQRLWSGELFENKENVLDDFNYNNGILSLTNKGGKSISGVLNNMSVRFQNIRSAIYITIRSNGNEMQISKVGNFSDKQWETMIGVFMLAGTTYGSNIFSSMYSNLSKVNIALKVIKLVSEL